MLISIPCILLAVFFPIGSIFPNDEALRRFVTDYCRLGDYKPEVWVERKSVHIEYRTHEMVAETGNLRRIVQLSEAGRFAEARRLVVELLSYGATESSTSKADRNNQSGRRSFEENLRLYLGATKRIQVTIFVSTTLRYILPKQQYCERLPQARGVIAVNC